MNILKAIGGAFTKLWRWIKETAWVQPLLIVGAIFAVIFSIPKITEWVNSWGIGSASSYYSGFRQSLEGETDDIKDYNSEADQITSFIQKASNFDDAYTTYAEYRNFLETNYSNELNKYGEKFYLVYVGTDCDSCETIQPGIKYAQTYWKDSIVPADGRDFKMYTIFEDEDSTNDDDYDLEADQKAFNRYLNKFLENDFFSDAGGRLSDLTPYKTNASIGDSNYDYFTEANTSSFSVPTIVLVDFSEEAFNLKNSRPGVSEVLFGLSGSDAVKRAELLVNMWNHTSDDTSNPFTDAWVKVS